MTNWKTLLSSSGSEQALQSFASGNLSKNKTADSLRFTSAAGEFRRLVRSNGTRKARALTRKALQRRGLN